ncbi:MAG: hypothetical protein V3U76_07035 [Granulosicoccus sp.]
MKSTSHPFTRQQRNLRDIARASLLLLVLFIAGGSTLPTHAAGSMSREQAISRALQQSGGNGKVLGVRTTKNDDGSIVYSVKILTDGRVKVYRIRSN